ncbi:UPF0716 family protein affecting phage T7 exclusion [Bradyrhizobium sp. AZCC 2176]
MVETFQPPRFGAGQQPVKPAHSGRRLAAAFDFATANHFRAIVFLVLCGIVLFLPGFFNIPAIDRDEARFAQATKQMVESGDFVDIRFQDDVRYKKPVGIYWLQAAVVETASSLGLPRAQLRIWLYRIPSLIGAIGAVLLTYWAALAFVTRRGAALAALMMCSSVLLGAEARLAKTDAMLLLTVVAAMGAMARVYLSWQRGEDPVHPSWSAPAIFWTALAGGILLKGPLILMFVGLTILALAILDRSAAWLWRLRPVWGLMWTLVLVLPWFVAIFWRAGEAFFSNSLGGDMLSKLGAQESHGAPPGLYLLLFWITFWPGAALAGMAAPAVWRARRRARRAISAGVAGAVMDRVRTGADQAAALRAAALSGDCDPHHRRAGAPRAVAVLADARCRMVVCHSGGGIRDRRHRRHQADALPRLSGLALPRGGDDLRSDRVVDVRGQPRRAIVVERRSRGDVSGDRNLRHRHAIADHHVSKCGDRAGASQRGLRRAKGSRGGLSRAEPRLHDRHRHVADRRIGRCRFSGAGQLPLCAGGIAHGTRLRPARRSDRAALQRGQADRGL